MGFRSGSYAKVFDIKNGENYVDLRIAISKKNKESGEYITEFGGFVRCYGKDCVAKALKLKIGDRIKLGDVDVTQRYDKEKKVNYTNFKMFSFEVEDGNSTSTAKTATKPVNVDVTEDDSDLPF